MLTGIAPRSRVAEQQHRVRTAGGVVVVLAAGLVGVLLTNTSSIVTAGLNRTTAQRIVTEWLGDRSGFVIAAVDVEGEQVTVVLAGPGDPPPAERLVDDLADALDRSVVLDLQWVPRRRTLFTSGDQSDDAPG